MLPRLPPCRQRRAAGAGGGGRGRAGADQAARPRRRAHAAALHRQAASGRCAASTPSPGHVFQSGSVCSAPCHGLCVFGVRGRSCSLLWLLGPCDVPRLPASSWSPHRPRGRPVLPQGWPTGGWRRASAGCASSRTPTPSSSAPSPPPSVRRQPCSSLRTHRQKSLRQAAGSSSCTGRRAIGACLLVLLPTPPLRCHPRPRPRNFLMHSCRRVSGPRLRRQLAGGATQSQGGHWRHHPPHLPRRPVRRRSQSPARHLPCAVPKLRFLP